MTASMISRGSRLIRIMSRKASAVVALCCMLDGSVFAESLNSFPVTGSVQGFGSDPPNSRYYASFFTAQAGGLNQIVVPVLGSVEFRVLVADTDQAYFPRPTTVLYESPPMWSPNQNANPWQEPVFYQGQPRTVAPSFYGSAWLNVHSGDRSQDFASPVRTNPSAVDVWTYSATNNAFTQWEPDAYMRPFALFLGFGSGTTALSDIIVRSSTGFFSSVPIPDLVEVRPPSIDLQSNRTYALIFEGVSVAVPEPSTCFSLAAGLAIGYLGLRCRRTSRN